MKNMLKVALVAGLVMGYAANVVAGSSFSSSSRSSSSYKSSSSSYKSSSSSYKSSSSSYKSPSSYSSSSRSSSSSSYAPSANKSYNSTNSYSGSSSSKYTVSSPSSTIAKPKPLETSTVKKAMDSNPTLKSYGSIVTKSEVPVKSTKDPMVPSSKPTTSYIPPQPKTVPNVNQSMGYAPQNVVQPKTFGISPTVKNVAVGAAVGAGAVMVADHLMADSHHDTVVSAPSQQSSGNQHYQSSNNGYNSNNQSYNNRNYNNSRPRQNTGAPYTYYGLGTAYNHRQLDSSKFFRNYWMYRAMMGSSYHKPLYVYHTANSNYYSNLTDAEWVDVQKSTETYLAGMKSVKEYLDRGFADCAGKPYSCFDSGDKKENAKFAYNTAFYEGFMKTQEGKTVKSDIPDLKARVFDSFSYDMHRHQELIFKIKVPVEGDKDVVQAAKEGYFSGYAVGLYVNKNNMQ